jgi:4-hydroxybenzoate polyprenyltransferase
MQVGLFMLAALALLVVSTTFLDPVTRYLWPIPVALFVAYPYTKRFTWLCHVVLGVCVGLAPTGAWLAIQGELSVVPVLLTASIALWVAGFDVIYSSQDADVDRSEGLHSIPVRFGLARGLQMTRVAHFCTIAGLGLVGVLANLAWPYFVGVLLCAALLAYENAIVSAHDMSRADAAFFTINGFVGIIYAAGVFASIALS